MVVRSVVLFAHIVGMLVLFVGLALEWLSLEALQRSSTPAQETPWLNVLRALPRYMATAVGVILISGIYMAARVGVLDNGWVRVSFGAMFLMGILGGPVVRSQMRALRDAGSDDRDGTPSTLRRHASHPRLRASLRARTAVGLAIIFLMIGKPDLGESLLLIGAALVLGVAMSLPQQSRFRTPLYRSQK
jgi:uncharacterized membrane protein